METAIISAFIRPCMVVPSLAMSTKMSPGVPSSKRPTWMYPSYSPTRNLRPTSVRSSGTRRGVPSTGVATAAADQALRLDEREVRLDPGRVAVHHEADRPGRREHRGLRVPEAVHLAEV